MTELDGSEYEALQGRPCPVCDTDIDAGSLRWNGVGWEHKNPDVHPQAGHHRIPDDDVLDLLGDRDTDTVLTDGGATKAPDADQLPDRSAADARKAVIDAARKDGTTCQRGAYRARRTWMENDGGYVVDEDGPVVVLSTRTGYGGDVVAIFPARPHHELRPSWTHPTPDWFEPGDDVLPRDDFDVDDIFLEARALPRAERRRPNAKVVDGDGEPQGSDR